ncbi:MAG TPA: TAT-variant-translocated molybdopterin oxidoreductase [Bryobacteraceae bacterium]|nr:TAT-variant-translocated molybdopterin oxidoreductase [Bryobacteraceae bacterium]
MSNDSKFDLERIRAVLAGKRGRDYWRSLEDLADSEEFQDVLHREFPRQASEWPEEDAAGRRHFLKVMGASLALAGLTACTKQPPEQIMPYVRQPEGLIPGRPQFFATAHSVGGMATGLLVESHEGRPTKVEGNPEHPASLGAADAFSQASVLQLYDPDRSQALRYEGEIRSWGVFQAAIRGMLAEQRADQGAGFRILTGAVTSPTMGDQINALLKEMPRAKWHQWEPASPHGAHAGAVMAFGQPFNTYYDLRNADVIVSLDADILGSGPASLRYARQFAIRRRARSGEAVMNRLYVVEPMPSPTGTIADHRLPARAGDVEPFAVHLASGVGVGIGSIPKRPPNPEWEKWIPGMVRDLQAHRGRSLVVAGDHQPPAVHALAHAMNQLLGNVGATVFYTDPVEVSPVDHVASLQDLAKDLDAGTVNLLVIIGSNPVLTAPADLGMRERIQRARMRVHMGLYDDETAELCQWHLPEAHYLEAWGDARAFDGTVSIVQPLIMPLYQSRSAYELLGVMALTPQTSGLEIVRGYWSRQRPGADFEAFWRRAVHDGVVPDTALPARTPALRFGWSGTPPQPGGLEIVFRPDPSVYDGRFANLGWLQELPKPVTKLTWDNAAIMSPGTANLLKVANSSVVELDHRGRKVRAAVFIQPGHANGSVTVHLGYGRRRGGRVASGAGFDAYPLRTSGAIWNDFGLVVKDTGDKHTLATTQGQHILDARRHVIRHADIGSFRKDPNVTNIDAEAPPRELSMYPEYKYEGYAWGMAIDMSVCTGCSACVVACQAENNIPVVGKDQTARGRAMHWLRIDTYYQGSFANPEVFHQPMLCQHCETAPCELVCPVAATAHSAEGLNDMVYNRCVGTRYCSNNCPYKVRRFNFLQYSDVETPSLKLLRNPDVTVRNRGVMEKCTYCVQRIQTAKIRSENENRKVRDGEIQTACQAACPTEAIVFGDINDPNSRVSRMKAESHNYGVLADLNTRPRTTYLAILKNPNPDIGQEA